MDEAVATYRRNDGREEIRIYHEDAAESPLGLDPWCRFLTLRNGRYRHGSAQLTKEELDEQVAAARERGEDRTKVLPVYMYVHSGIAFSLDGFADAWDSGQCGVLILERKVCCDEYGLEWDGIRERAAQVLDQYESWVMGWCWRFRRYRLTKCDHGETHRTDITEESDESHGRGDWYGADPEKTGILDEAGIGVANHPGELAEGWTREAATQG